MCINCGNKKENLRLPIPEYVDKYRMNEYVSLKDTKQLSVEMIFNYFKEFFGGEWVFNPKQIRRAMINMDELYFLYKKGELNMEYEIKKIMIEDKYLFEYKDHTWNLVDKKAFLKKGMKYKYTPQEFDQLIKQSTEIQFL